MRPLWSERSNDGGGRSAPLALEPESGSLYGLQVRAIEINGTHATATVAVLEGGAQHVEPFFLERQAGKWRVDTRGLTLAHEGFRIYRELECPPRSITMTSVAMRASRAPSAKAFLRAYLGRDPRRAPASLVPAGVDYVEATRTFVSDWRRQGARPLPRDRDESVHDLPRILVLPRSHRSLVDVDMVQKRREPCFPVVLCDSAHAIQRT